MRILVVNPNSTASMTAKIGRAAQLVAAPGTEILAVNPPDTPASIEGYVDEALCLPGLLATIDRYAGPGAGGPGVHGDVAGTVIACFDDPGLDAARALTAKPVVGVCEAAVRMATLVAGRFSIVTTTSRSVPAIEHLAQRYGVAGRCRVRAAAVPVLALEEPGSDARRRVGAEIARALEEDGAEAIVLGCAGMADLARDYTAEFGVPVIDGVTAAVKLVEGLAALGLTTAKRGGYAFPAPK
ncbi:aspartate/glutamate racemase family protein [Azospirillum sp. RWY-5-1]|uniref:Aspartate/glutamate racemase family protein n=1 Tax=Azospirillum oleiclasticum TaxID=2735135 RepID=A0ABX2TC38_9PROT|nr:aspartate/glutamate racemase family protein [Azospirillum oleiclasticum]NYZ15629.1 aspartate/glutamate racemase family protein [Azospirillum oleiclasticum]NYZ21899.1 aspartate/glutamate racemase family protein [Azospirillum oleiclasticum]